MWYRLTLLVSLIISGLAGLTGAIHSPAFPSSATLPLPPNVPNAAAEQTLQRAIDAMTPERLGCLETRLWHKVTLPDLTYEAKGRYLMGPDRRFRLELQTQQGDTVFTQL